MSLIDKKKIYRVLDANFNRAKEGLRVCEDVSRFIKNNPAVTRKLKSVRHQLTVIFLSFPSKTLLQGRDVGGDVGRTSTTTEFQRKKVDDIFFANIQRVKESIRVLEEFTKLINKKYAEELKKLRYQIYVIEKTAVSRR